jgi:hypothetical protein
MKENQNWPDLAAALLDKLTGSNPEITFDFDNLELLVPDSKAPEAPQGRWKLNGTIRIRTRSNDGQNNQQ